MNEKYLKMINDVMIWTSFFNGITVYSNFEREYRKDDKFKDTRFIEHIHIYIFPESSNKEKNTYTENLKKIMKYLDDNGIEYEIISNETASAKPHIRIYEYREYK